MQATLTLPEVREMARTIRKDVLVQVYKANSGHPGGPLSAADYLSVLWFRHLRIDPKNPSWRERDRFVLSNGHCSALNYSLLARRGFIPASELITFREPGSHLQGHPNRLKVPGLEASTGSLGQGMSIGLGMAFGARIDGLKDVRVFVNVGDGELQEGCMWEAIMAAGHYRANNLIAMVDFNDAQIDGRVEDIMGVEPLGDKFRSFRWRVIEADGHDLEAVEQAFITAQKADTRPTVILFRTKMMHGTPSFEDNPGWHGKPLNHDQMVVALKELGFDLDPDVAVEQYARGEA
jgi:transketolase